jgi:hypothetical protein
MLGMLGGAVGLSAVTGCLETGSEPPQPTPKATEELTGTGVSGPLLLPALLTAGSSSFTVTGNLPPISGGQVWVVIDAYNLNGGSPIAEVFPVLGFQGATITIDGKTARTHAQGAIVAILEDGIVTPQLMGCHPVGTNAAPFINFAIAAVHALGGGTVYFPRANYQCQSNVSLPENVNLAGDGPASAIEFFDGSTLVWAATSPTTPLNAALSNLSVESLRLTNPCMARLKSVVVDGSGIIIDVTSQTISSLVDLESCDINASGDAILVNTPATYPNNTFAMVNVRYCQISALAGWGIRVSGGPAQLKVDGNQIAGSSGGITGSLMGSSIVRNFFPLSDVSGSPSAFVAGAEVRGVAIADNIVSTTSQSAFLLTPSSGGAALTVTNNHLTQTRNLGVPPPAIVMRGVKHSSVRGNLAMNTLATFSGDYDPSNDYGFQLQVYRFLLTGIAPGRMPATIPTEGGSAGGLAINSYVMPDTGQILGLTAYVSGTVPAGVTYDVQALIGGVVELDTGAVAASAAFVTASSLQPQPMATGPFPAGVSLTVQVSTTGAGAAWGDLVVEILVGLNNPGGEIT